LAYARWVGGQGRKKEGGIKRGNWKRKKGAGKKIRTRGSVGSVLGLEKGIAINPHLKQYKKEGREGKQNNKPAAKKGRKKKKKSVTGRETHVSKRGQPFRVEGWTFGLRGL